MKTAVEQKKTGLENLRIGVLETRRQTEISQLIAGFGGQIFLAPALREVPLEENKAVLNFEGQLQGGHVQILILFTGVGAKILIQTLALKRPLDDVIKDLKKLVLVARGPKPVAALKEFGLEPTTIVPDPHTWRETLKILDVKTPLEGRTVAVQEQGEPNRLFLSELKARGATVLQVPVYRTALPEDTTPLHDLIQKTIQSELDVLLLTNSSQAENVMAIARRVGQAQNFRHALSRLVVASIGPYCSETLHQLGIPVDIESPQPIMKALIEAVNNQAQNILEKKQVGGIKAKMRPTGVAQAGDSLHDSLFMKACRREKTSRTPIWLMRQAGRYMKEYRELRAKVSFLELCKNSDLASEVTVDAAHRLDVDAAIIFSDLLLMVEPLGFDLSYGKEAGPEISNPFREVSHLRRLKPVNVEESLSFVFDAIRKTRKALKPNIPLIGFAGAPFTMASYMIEGHGSKNFIQTKALMYEAPKIWQAFLEKITEATIDYINAQVEAGAQAIQVFDSWVGCLAPEDFRVYVLPHTRRLIQNITPGVPVISFGTQTAGLLPLFKEAGGDVIGIDWRIELDEAWDMLGDVAIQGNLDPAVLLSNPKEIKEKAKRILNQAGGRPGHIFNLGHGVLPETPLENVSALIETVKELSER